ncbi:MAG: hypothetical protein QM811_18265 [Pirellulales bacterium]
MSPGVRWLGVMPWLVVVVAFAQAPVPPKADVRAKPVAVAYDPSSAV